MLCKDNIPERGEIVVNVDGERKQVFFDVAEVEVVSSSNKVQVRIRIS